MISPRTMFGRRGGAADHSSASTRVNDVTDERAAPSLTDFTRREKATSDRYCISATDHAKLPFAKRERPARRKHLWSTSGHELGAAHGVVIQS